MNVVLLEEIGVCNGKGRTPDGRLQILLESVLWIPFRRIVLHGWVRVRRKSPDERGRQGWALQV
jgi:hypothetical protein